MKQPEEQGGLQEIGRTQLSRLTSLLPQRWKVRSNKNKSTVLCPLTHAVLSKCRLYYCCLRRYSFIIIIIIAQW